eukprot:2531502-Pyramimonas_sp.AAC.1
MELILATIDCEASDAFVCYIQSSGCRGEYRARTNRNRFRDIRRVRLPNLELRTRCASELGPQTIRIRVILRGA